MVVYVGLASFWAPPRAHGKTSKFRDERCRDLALWAARAKPSVLDSQRSDNGKGNEPLTGSWGCPERLGQYEPTTTATARDAAARPPQGSPMAAPSRKHGPPRHGLDVHAALRLPLECRLPIESQFDDVPGPCRPTRRAGRHFWQLYEGGLRVLPKKHRRRRRAMFLRPRPPELVRRESGTGTVRRWAGLPRGPPFIHGQEAAARFQNSTEDAEGPRREVLAERDRWVCGRRTVLERTHYALPKKAERQKVSKSGWARDRSIRFRKDQEDRLFGSTITRKVRGADEPDGANATIGCKIGKGKRVSFLKDAVAAHDHFQDSERDGRQGLPEVAIGDARCKQRPAFGNAIPRDCLPKQGVPRKTPRPVFENKALHKLLTENKPLRRRKDDRTCRERPR